MSSEVRIASKQIKAGWVAARGSGRGGCAAESAHPDSRLLNRLHMQPARTGQNYVKGYKPFDILRSNSSNCQEPDRLNLVDMVLRFSKAYRRLLLVPVKNTLR